MFGPLTDPLALVGALCLSLIVILAVWGVIIDWRENSKDRQWQKRVAEERRAQDEMHKALAKKLINGETTVNEARAAMGLRPLDSD